MSKKRSFKNHTFQIAKLLLITKTKWYCNLNFSHIILKRKKRVLWLTLLKPNNPLNSPKAYWSILKPFYDDTKIPLIPRLVIDNKVITNFREKANLFNNFFTSQCMPSANDSMLLSTVMRRTENRLSTYSF